MRVSRLQPALSCEACSIVSGLSSPVPTRSALAGHFVCVFKSAPGLIVKVLSPSTTRIDRREKLVAYKELPSLHQYILVHQNRIRIEMHKRVGDMWELSVLGQPEELVLEALPDKPLFIPVSLVYEGVSLPSVVKESEEEYQMV